MNENFIQNVHNELTKEGPKMDKHFWRGFRDAMALLALSAVIGFVLFLIFVRFFG